MLRSAPFWYRTFPRLTHAMRRLCRANYEPEMTLLDALCDRSRIGVDVGAKVGMYTYRIRKHAAAVLAFEPQPMLYDMLRAVFDGKGGVVEPYALSNRRGMTTMRVPYAAGGDPELGRSTIEQANPLANLPRTDEIIVETRRLDDYRLDDVGFIKIDVEGHELAVLDGAEATLARNRPNLLVECNDDHHPDAVAKLRGWLAQHDYDGFFILHGALVGIEHFIHAEHWRNAGIENFICIHQDRADARRAVADRLAELG